MLIAETTAEGPPPLRAAREDGIELFSGVDGTRHLALVHDAAPEQPQWTLQPVASLFSGGRCGPAAGGWLFRVGLWVPTEHRSEFLSWYEQEHLSILLACPAWDGCRFVEAPAALGCRFIALQQLADPAALSSSERARSRATPWFMRLSQFDWFDEPFARALYRRAAGSSR
jgi:hypothetical protein